MRLFQKSKKKKNIPAPKEGVIISGDVNPLWHRLLSHKKLNLIVGGVIVLALVIGGGLYAFQQLKDDNANKVVCTDDILNQAAPVMEATKDNVSKLLPIVDNITKMPHYDTDVNCLGMVTTYYIGVGRAADARASYDKLSKIYDAGKGYSPIIADKILSLKALEKSVIFLESNQPKANEKNSGGFNAHPPGE